MFNVFPKTSYLINCKGSKLALLHRVKERKSLSLSDLASGYTLFPEGGVVWKIPFSLIYSLKTPYGMLKFRSFKIFNSYDPRNIRKDFLFYGSQEKETYCRLYIMFSSYILMDRI